MLRDIIAHTLMTTRLLAGGRYARGKSISVIAGRYLFGFVCCDCCTLNDYIHYAHTDIAREMRTPGNIATHQSHNDCSRVWSSSAVRPIALGSTNTRITCGTYALAHAKCTHAEQDLDNNACPPVVKGRELIASFSAKWSCFFR